jgi:hypothetical protein
MKRAVKIVSDGADEAAENRKADEDDDDDDSQ